MFDTEATASIKQIIQLWKDKDITTLSETIHMLKGFSLNVGATQLAHLCSRLELEMTHAQEIETVITTLHDVFEKTKYYLKQQLGEEV
ncbi:Hpt domain-containing protein [Paenibacillus antarcticus]|uniref:HPt domain-containing protein n=1 Tax=Paenibacillus antarcticus TaxID=253703 RepID=A0A168JBX0_9BACL|nr:Hpt domain-containing protein [Paenibacillus antarcticus]OAB40421.1 hypothetical protein PBAT_24290 [Paenibacillus antarcticus]